MPCQLTALAAAVGYKIHDGHFGDVRLDGLNVALFVHFPGAIHEGNGTKQLVIDERADARQRDALVKILSPSRSILRTATASSLTFI
jgi:hypothetical protein